MQNLHQLQRQALRGLVFHDAWDRRLAKTQPKGSSKRQKSDKSIQKAKAAGVEHARFQKQHYQQKIEPPAGHWHAFLKGVMDKNAVLTCAVCSTLQSKVWGAQTEVGMVGNGQPAEQQLVPVEPSQPVLGPKVAKKGRPPKSEAQDQRWNLHVFIKLHRAEMYLQTADSFAPDKFTYRCLACKRNIGFQSQTNPEKLHRHERGGNHKIRGLRKLAGEPEQAGEDEADEEEAGVHEALPIRDADNRCQGISCDDSSLPVLHSFKESFENWVFAGQPSTMYAEREQNPIAELLVRLEGRSVWVSSKNCQGKFYLCDLACQQCRQQALCKGVHKHVCKMSYLVDLCSLAHKLSHSTQACVRDFVAVMEARDYKKLGYAGDDLAKFLSRPSNVEKVRAIVHKFHCIPAWRLNPSLKSLVNTWLVSTPSFHANDVESSAHACLVQQLSSAVRDGQCQSGDLELAAKVAAGRLRGDSLVQGLVTSFLSMFEEDLRNRRFRTSSKHVAATQDALLDMGQSEEMRRLLERFCVNAKALPPLQIFSDLLPRGFLALQSQEKLRTTLRCAFEAGFRSPIPHVRRDGVLRKLCR